MSTKHCEQHQRIAWPLSLEGTKSTGGKDGFSIVCLRVVPLLFSVLGFEGRWEVDEEHFLPGLQTLALELVLVFWDFSTFPSYFHLYFTLLVCLGFA